MDAEEQLVLPGPQKSFCICGCQKFGTPRKKIWIGESVGHVRTCVCRKCVGGRVKARARVRENKIAKAISGTRAYASGVISGYDVEIPNIVEIEETANATITRGLRRWWFSKQVQSKLERLMTRKLRPRAFVASWDNKPQLVLMTFQDFAELCQLVEPHEHSREGVGQAPNP